MFERYTSKLMISPKTSIGGYVFDVYPSINHTLSATLTSHPTQYGANISDHKFDEPDQLVFQIGMSDSSQDLVIGQFYKIGALNKVKEIQLNDNGEVIKESFSDKWRKFKKFISNSRSVNAFNKLNELKLRGIPLTCVTRLATYENMIITNIVADDTNETKYGLRATVTMREIITSNLEKVQITSTASITQTNDLGGKSAMPFTSTWYDEEGVIGVGK